MDKFSSFEKLEFPDTKTCYPNAQSMIKENRG